jgi:hypothetical protein
MVPRKTPKLTYANLSRLLRDDSKGYFVVKNTQLHEQVKKLTETAFPIIRNETDTRWFNFYVPLKFQRELKCALIELEYYNVNNISKEEYMEVFT